MRSPDLQKADHSVVFTSVGKLQYTFAGEYEPSPSDRVREQVELYEATNGVEGGTLNGKPVIVLTTNGAKSSKIRAKFRCLS